MKRQKNGAISTTDRVVWNIDSNIEATSLSLVVLLLTTKIAFHMQTVLTKKWRHLNRKLKHISLTGASKISWNVLKSDL